MQIYYVGTYYILKVNVYLNKIVLPLVIKSDSELATIPILCSRFESIILYGFPLYSSLAIFSTENILFYLTKTR